MLSKEVSSAIFLRLWYDPIWDWTPVSRTIGEYPTHLVNMKIYIYIIYVKTRNLLPLLNGLLYLYHQGKNYFILLHQESTEPFSLFSGHNKQFFFNIHTHLYISNMLTDPKAPFLITTTSGCRWESYSFLWITSLSLDQYFKMLSV